MPLIRDTLDPTREREVSDEEALDLERMGLLLDQSVTRARTDEGLRAAAVRQVLDRQVDRAAEAAPTVPVAPADEVEDVVDDDSTPPDADAASGDTDDTDDTQES